MGPINWSDEDVRNLYRFVLRREPESEAIVSSMPAHEPDHLLRMFFSSEEFIEFLDGVAARGLQSGLDSRGVPAEELVAWAARRVARNETARRALLSTAPSWLRLYRTLLSDEQFKALVGADSPQWEERLKALEAQAGIIGGIEAVDGHVIRGWVHGFDRRDAPLIVEVWAGEAFVSAVVADRFRRDVQDRFGGDGRAGFEAPLPEEVCLSDRDQQVELRAGGGLIGRAVVHRREPTLDGMAAAARELAEVRQLLERLEARIPWVEAAAAQPLSNYAAYAAAWRDYGADIPVTSCSNLVIVDAVGRSASALADTVLSLTAQTIPPEALSIALVVEEGQRLLAEDLRNRCAWQGWLRVSVHVTEAPSPADRIMGAFDAVGARGDVCLFLVAGDDLAPGALRRIDGRFDGRSEVHAVYFDEDCYEGEDREADSVLRRRGRPLLKPGFDRDLLLQHPYVGRRIAVRSDLVRTFGLNDAAGDDFGAELVLRLSDQGGLIDHIGRVLLGRWSTEEASDWRAVVEAYLPREGVAVLDHEDQLGAHVEGAVRVRRAPAAAKACVIIATKDGLDLLRPCVDSILDRRGSNATPFDLIIIDHESQSPETQAYLADLADKALARILPYKGEFNWALMNNLAAAETDAEVLIFLNNDTVVLTRDWLDELVSQAQRPEVGLVGCRLLYGDGTIQHAGFVAREEIYSFLVHEGVGQPGSSPGYMGRHALLRSCVAVTGACVAIRAEAFRALGGFDAASLPVEGNDVDLCMRAQAEGLKVLYDPFATLYHLESKSRGFNFAPVRQARAEAASRLLWKRWGERFSRDPGFNPHFDRLSAPFARLRPPPPYSG
ncbi:glycosyltransferase [Brevundimonas sp.]|uniref:glycosyltransferase n=1 Tax=Brevundimonas sp. TaxID=1871086 RepID=UPI0028984C99|nr:glycosyltransferase [Brevundimonas sp.]